MKRLFFTAEDNYIELKPILGLAISVVVTLLGILVLYQLFSVSVPTVGWTIDNFLTLGLAFFMVFSGGTEIFRRVRVMVPSSEDSKRCGSCGAMVPSIAKFCRECGKQFSVAGK